MHTRWQELLEQPLDAVLVLTSGDHAPVAIAAAQAGKHVFGEKPMALSGEHGARMLDAAESAGVRLMVGMMRRYDPAYERLVALLPEQDVLPDPDNPDEPAADQCRNREFLRDHGL